MASRLSHIERSLASVQIPGPGLSQRHLSQVSVNKKFGCSVGLFRRCLRLRPHSVSPISNVLNPLVVFNAF